VIECGWCGKPTPNGDRCTSCGHEYPRRPWEQRAMPVPTLTRAPGRPRVDAGEAARRLAAAGPHATDEQVAAHWEVDPRTVRHWRAKVSG
jgi:hypothetical protein